MTMTPPASGARAARAARSRARAVVVGTVCGLLTLVGVLPAAAADGPPPSPPLVFHAAAEADGILRPDGTLTVALSVDNPTDSTVAAGAVDIVVSQDPLGSRASVDSWLSGGDAPALRRIGRDTIDSIAAHGATSTTTTVEVPDDVAPGVYALRATYRSAQGTLVSRGVWVAPDRPDDADDTDESDDPGQVAVIVPITAGPLTTGLLTGDELAALTAAGGSLRTQLDAVTGLSAILAVDPAIPAAIRVLGSDAPPSATEWLADLLSMPHPRFALQFGDADLAVQQGADLAVPLQVTSLAPYLDAAGFADASTPTPATDAAALPGLAALTDIGAARGDVYWPASGTAGADTVAWLDTAGGPSAITLVPSDTVSGAAGAPASADNAQLLVYDADVSTALHAASTSDARVERSAALAVASAYGTFTAADAPLLVTVDRAGDRSAAALRTTVRAAARLDGRTAITLDGLAAASDVAEVRVADTDPAAARVAALDRFLADEGDLAEFATILDDPSLLTAPERASVLQLLGNAWLTAPEAWTDAVAAHRAATAATLTAVGIVPIPDINLLGSSAPLNLSVRNDLPWPVSLVLEAQPNDPRLVVQTTTPVAAGELQTTRVDVPVEARVGTGESSLDLQLRSPSMVPIGERVTIEVSVRAEWEAVGIVVMAVLVGGLLVLGVIRTVLRMRRRGREGAADG